MELSNSDQHSKSQGTETNPQDTNSGKRSQRRKKCQIEKEYVCGDEHC